MILLRRNEDDNQGLGVNGKIFSDKLINDLEVQQNRSGPWFDNENSFLPS